MGLMEQLGEYHIDDTKLYEWIPWGGLVRMEVMRNKDDSLLAVMRYKRKEPRYDEDGEEIRGPMTLKPLPALKEGWVLWTERQHYGELYEDYLGLLWNSGSAETVSGLEKGERIAREEREGYFLKVFSELKESVGAHAEAEVLSGQELLDYLYRTLAMGEESKPLPDTALFLDAYLTQDMGFKIFPNTFKVNGKLMAIWSLPFFQAYGEDLSAMFFKMLQTLDYRFVRRILIRSEKGAEKDLKQYMKEWCDLRKTVKDEIQNGLLDEICGYFTNVLVVSGEDGPGREDKTLAVERILEVMEIPYIVETKNFKETWWGTIPGIFRADIRPSIIGASRRDVLMPRRLEEDGHV